MSITWVRWTAGFLTPMAQRSLLPYMYIGLAVITVPMQTRASYLDLTSFSLSFIHISVATACMVGVSRNNDRNLYRLDVT